MIRSSKKNDEAKRLVSKIRQNLIGALLKQDVRNLQVTSNAEYLENFILAADDRPVLEKDLVRLNRRANLVLHMVDLGADVSFIPTHVDMIERYLDDRPRKEA